MRMFCTLLVSGSVLLAVSQHLIYTTPTHRDYLVGLVIALCCIQTIQLGRHMGKLLRSTTTTTATATWSLPQFYLTQYRGARTQSSAYRIDAGVECCPLVPVAALLTIITKQSSSSSSSASSSVEGVSEAVVSVTDDSLLTIWCLLSFLLSLLFIHSLIHSLSHHSRQPITQQHSNRPASDWTTAEQQTAAEQQQRSAAGADQLSAHAPVAAAAVLLTYIISTELDVSAIAVLVLLAAVQLLVNILLTRWLPLSFTVGESAILAQGTSLFMLCAGKQIYRATAQMLEYHTAAAAAAVTVEDTAAAAAAAAVGGGGELKVGWTGLMGWVVEAVLRGGGESVLSPNIQTDIFIITAVISCALVLVLLTLVPALRGSVAYYCLVLCVMSLFSFPVLLFFFNADFLTWLISKLISHQHKVSLFIYWLICCSVALAIVCLNAWKCLQPNDCEAVKQTCHVSTKQSNNEAVKQSKYGELVNQDKYEAMNQVTHKAVKQSNHEAVTQINPEAGKQSYHESVILGQHEAMKQTSSEMRYRVNGHKSPDNTGRASNGKRKCEDVSSAGENISSCSGSGGSSSRSCDSSGSSSSRSGGGGGWSCGTGVRKQFHVLAVCAAVPGLLLDAELTYMALTCAVVILVMLESIRVLNIRPFGEVLNLYFTLFKDDKDEGSVLLTHIYLVVGTALPLWFNASYSTTINSAGAGGIPVALFAGVISVGVGDSAASVVGSRRGRHKWKGCCKSIEGTLAAILSQILFLVLLYWLAGACHPVTQSVMTISWTRALLSVLLVSLCEACTTQIDNLVLPIFLYILLL